MQPITRLEYGPKSGAISITLFHSHSLVIFAEQMLEAGIAGAFQAGQPSGLIADIIPVHDLVQRLIAEYNETVNSLSDM